MIRRQWERLHSSENKIGFEIKQICSAPGTLKFVYIYTYMYTCVFV